MNSNSRENNPGSSGPDQTGMSQRLDPNAEINEFITYPDVYQVKDLLTQYIGVNRWLRTKRPQGNENHTSLLVKTMAKSTRSEHTRRQMIDMQAAQRIYYVNLGKHQVLESFLFSIGQSDALGSINDILDEEGEHAAFSAPLDPEAVEPEEIDTRELTPGYIVQLLDEYGQISRLYAAEGNRLLPAAARPKRNQRNVFKRFREVNDLHGNEQVHLHNEMLTGEVLGEKSMLADILDMLGQKSAREQVDSNVQNASIENLTLALESDTEQTSESE